MSVLAESLSGYQLYWATGGGILFVVCIIGGLIAPIKDKEKGEDE